MLSAILFLVVSAPRVDEANWKLNPRFLYGQELEYFGTITDSSDGQSGVRFEEPRPLHATVLTVEVDAKKNATLACYTEVGAPEHESPGDKTAVPASFRFESVVVSPRGQATWADNGALVSLPPDGNVPWEMGYLYEGPEFPKSTGETWMVRRVGEPDLRCRVLGTEKLGSVPCVRVAAVVESPNWGDKSHANGAWRIESLLWIDTREGLVQRVRREHQLRGPGQDAPSRIRSVHYDLSSNVRYHGQLLTERFEDFRAAYKLQGELDRLAQRPQRLSRSQVETLQKEMQFALDKPYASPYRPAMKKLIAIAGTVGQEKPPEPIVVGRGATGRSPVGRKAFPFTVRTVDDDRTISLKEIAGKSTVLVFVDPRSPLAVAAVRQAIDAVAQQSQRPARVLVVSISSDRSALAAFKDSLTGNYTLCMGSALDRRQGIREFPHTLYIDEAGIVRLSAPGYGPETTLELARALALPVPSTPQTKQAQERERIKR